MVVCRNYSVQFLLNATELKLKFKQYIVNMDVFYFLQSDSLFSIAQYTGADSDGFCWTPDGLGQETS